MATGKDLNKTFLENINILRDKILKDGMNESKLSGNVVDVSGDNSSFVINDDLDKFRAINALKNYLEFSTFRPDHTYEVYGAIVKDENGKQKVTNLYIREEDITKVADMADDFEKLLGIKLPSQVHQMKTKYANSVIPGTTSKSPRPKIMSETEKQYEMYLETFYEKLNMPKEESIDGIGREPYAHERIDYRTSDAISQNYTSEYYLRRFSIDRTQSLGAAANGRGAQNNRIGDNDRLTIKESEDVEKTPLGRKIGSALNSFETFFKNQSMWKKVRLGAIGGLIGAGAIYAAACNPVIALTGLYGLALGGGVLFLSKKLGKVCKKKINDWLYGPKLEREPEQTRQPASPTSEATPPHVDPPTPPVPPVNNPVPPVNSPTPTNGATPPPAPPVPPVNPSGNNPAQQPKPAPAIIPEQLDQFLDEAGINMEQYRDIERRVAVAESELAGLTPNTLEYQNKVNEIATLKKQQRDQLTVIEALMEEMIRDFNIQKSGGRSL